MSNTRMAWLRVSCLLAALFLARPAFADAPSPETTVKDAYAELSALLYAPPSEAREIEIAALIARHTDFAELTRRAFGEPCPVARCKDHWNDLSNVERDEVRTLFAAVLTREWTRALDRAFSYDVDVEKQVVHERDTRVRVLAREKGSTDPAVVIDLFFLANQPPYRLVDFEAHKVKASKSYYKQFDHELSTPSEGYGALVARLKKKLEREAGARDSGGEPTPVADAEVDPEPEADAAAEEPAPPPPPPPPPPSPPPAELPWGKIALGGLLALAVGIALGRMLGKKE
jgi:ABC-type transporter MlaC component